MAALEPILVFVVHNVIGALIFSALPTDDIIVTSDSDAINTLTTSINKLNSNLETIVGVQSET